jgi:hypothetical protein
MNISEIAREVLTQDNRMTNLPIFVVQQRRRILGIDLNYAPDTVWMTEDHEYEASPDDLKEIQRQIEQGKDVVGWEELGYVDVWEHVTSCFTNKGAEEYIKVNGHNLTEPRIYVASGYRNAEWAAMRELLKDIGKNVDAPNYTKDSID